MTTATHPAFPTEIPYHPLLVIDYELIKAGDKQEIDRLWEAGRSLGFWYLKNSPAYDEVEGMFDLGAETMALPVEEKKKFERADSGMSFGWKSELTGEGPVSNRGPNSYEFITIAKDDALAWPEVLRRTYPSTVNARMEGTVKPFVRESLEVAYTLLGAFNDRLGLPEGAIRRRHEEKDLSESTARVIRFSAELHYKGQLMRNHTDFGTISFVYNKLGGLQVLVPGSDEWQYVKPLPGHVICNVGDALSFFSGGILRSNRHRVIAPPGHQTAYERWTVVYFVRASNPTVVRPLLEESSMIAEAVKNTPDAKFDTGATLEEWVGKRIK